MISNSQKEHLTYTAIGQVAVLFWIASLLYSYIIPWYKEITASLTTTNAIIEKYNKTESDGISYVDLWGFLGGKPEYTELIKIIQADPKNTEEVIKKKEWAWNYLSWLKEVIWGDASNRDKKLLVLQKALLNSVIPTMSPANNNIEESNITLKQYVKFIEWSILKKFNFKSNTALWMQGITFWNKDGNVPSNIGMFEFRIDFQSTNADILNFIQFVNKAWNPEILWYTGNVAPAIMSDPLITFSNLSIQDIIDKDNPSAENGWRATITFYVRGITKEDLAYLKENLKVRREDLWKKIDDAIKFCTANKVLCPSNKKLDTFQLKFKEFQRSIWKAVVSGWGNDEIYPLTQQANTVKALEAEFETIIPKKK